MRNNLSIFVLRNCVDLVSFMEIGKTFPELRSTRRRAGMEKENGFTLEYAEFSLLLNNLSI